MKKTSLVTIGFILAACGTAFAGEPTMQQRAEAEMSQGKDYADAWAIASRAEEPTWSAELAVWAARAEEALREGEDYIDAWQQVGSPPATPEELAKVRGAEQQINAGIDPIEAVDATH